LNAENYADVVTMSVIVIVPFELKTDEKVIYTGEKYKALVDECNKELRIPRRVGGRIRRARKLFKKHARTKKKTVKGKYTKKRIFRQNKNVPKL